MSLHPCRLSVGLPTVSIRDQDLRLKTRVAGVEPQVLPDPSLGQAHGRTCQMSHWTPVIVSCSLLLLQMIKHTHNSKNVFDRQYPRDMKGGLSSLTSPRQPLLAVW